MKHDEKPASTKTNRRRMALRRQRIEAMRDNAITKILHAFPTLLNWRHDVLGSFEQPSSTRCLEETRECEQGLRVNLLRGVAEFADVLYYATPLDLSNPRVVICFLHLLHRMRRSSWYEVFKLIHGKWVLSGTADGPLARRPYIELKRIYHEMASWVCSIITPREESYLFTWGGLGGKQIAQRIQRLRSGVTTDYMDKLPPPPAEIRV